MELLKIKKSMPVRINGILYKQVTLTSKNAKVDAKVLDLRDGRYSEIVTIHDKNRVAINIGVGAELGVDIKNLRLLNSILGYIKI